MSDDDGLIDGSRLVPLSNDQWGDTEVAALRNAFPGNAIQAFQKPGRAPNVVATMLHNPALAGSFYGFANVLLRKPAIGHRARELMVLRVAWRTVRSTSGCTTCCSPNSTDWVRRTSPQSRGGSAGLVAT